MKRHEKVSSINKIKKNEWKVKSRNMQFKLLALLRKFDLDPDHSEQARHLNSILILSPKYPTIR